MSDFKLFNSKPREWKDAMKDDRCFMCGEQRSAACLRLVAEGVWALTICLNCKAEIQEEQRKSK